MTTARISLNWRISLYSINLPDHCSPAAIAAGAYFIFYNNAPINTYDLFTQSVNKNAQVKACFKRFHQTLDIYTDLLQNFRTNNREIAALSA